MADTKEKKQGKKCFIITPIGNDGSETFRKAKGVIESVIKPVLLKYGFSDIKPAYEIVEPGMIGNQIINRIVNDDLVVANLTGNNPNVMYELAIRHAVAKPIIHICEKGTNLPFDIKDNRTAFYTDDMLGSQELQNDFEDYVKNIDYSKEYKDNPIYSGLQMGILLKKMDEEGRQTEAELLQKILDMVSGSKEKSSMDRYTRQNDRRKYYSWLLDNSDYSIKVGRCDSDEFDAFYKDIHTKMAKIDVEVLGSLSNIIYIKNNGNCDSEKIMHYIGEVADQCDISSLSIEKKNMEKRYYVVGD